MSTSRILEFPLHAVRPSSFQAAARHQLEQYRQTRLKDCPFKAPVAVPLALIDDAALPPQHADPLQSHSTLTWEQIAAVTEGKMVG